MSFIKGTTTIGVKVGPFRTIGPFGLMFRWNLKNLGIHHMKFGQSKKFYMLGQHGLVEAGPFLLEY